MNKDHLNFLYKIDHFKQGPVGRNALIFGNKVQNLEKLASILNKQLDRSQLLEICANLNNSDITATIAILAWGGMRFDHARSLFQNWQHLDPIVNNLRTKQILTRQEAFSILKLTRAKGKLPGLGISYFTKLICFLNPELEGFILDQWTGKSINILWGDPLVHISKSGWVTDENTSKTYEVFCLRVVELGEKLKCDPLIAEERIFSVGGRNPGEWRRYLKSNYPQQWL